MGGSFVLPFLPIWQTIRNEDVQKISNRAFSFIP